MLWRHKRIFLLQSPQLIPLRLLSIQSFSSSSKTTKTNQSPNFYHKAPKFTLTPQFVHSTLSKSPSDLLALLFFLWCAKQNNYFHDRQAFTHMLHVVTRLTHKCKSVKSIIRELKSVGCVIKPQTFLLLLRIYWHGKMDILVFDTFDEMCRFGFKPNTFAHNVIMDVLFRNGQVEGAITVLKRTHLPNFLSFNMAVCSLCKLNDLVRLKDVIRIMFRKGYVPNVGTFDLVFDCFCKAGRLKEAHQVLGLMISFGISVSVNVWSMLINGLCKLRQADKAGLMLVKMIEIGMSPNVVTYTTLFKGLMESQMVDSAKHVLNIMESRGCSHDLVLSNVLIHFFSKSGYLDDALNVFENLLKQNIVPDSFTFCTLLSALSLSKNFSLDIANGLRVEADLVLCNALLSYFIKAGHPSHAVDLYTKIIDKRFTPDNYSLVGRLGGLCDSGKINEAVNWYQEDVMNAPGLDAHVHTVIIDRLMKIGEYNIALKLFRNAIAEKYNLDIISYMVVIRGLLNAKKNEEAYDFYTKIKELGGFPDAYICSFMLSVFCKERNEKIVEQLMIDVNEAGIQVDSHTLIKVFKFLRRKNPSSSVLNRITEILNLRLVNDQETRALLYQANDPLFDSYLKNNQFVR
ncbi:hypothetical protein ACFE04_031483 [Oxalis oulophora]